MIFQEYHFREIWKSYRNSRDNESQTWKVKDEMYLVSTNVTATEHKFQKTRRCTCAYLFVVGASIHTRRVIALIFIIFLLMYSRERVPMHMPWPFSCA